MFQFPAFAPHGLWIQPWVTGYEPCRVAPFGNPRIKGCLHLPEAYRSLPRPSSLPRAKASTLRPLMLDFYFPLAAIEGLCENPKPNGFPHNSIHEPAGNDMFLSTTSNNMFPTDGPALPPAASAQTSASHHRWAMGMARQFRLRFALCQRSIGAWPVRRNFPRNLWPAPALQKLPGRKTNRSFVLQRNRGFSPRHFPLDNREVTGTIADPHAYFQPFSFTP